MEAIEAPLIVTFTPGEQVSHPVRYIIFPCDATGIKLVGPSVSLLRTVTNYQYRRDDFINGNLYTIENKLFICRIGQENIYLIQIPKGLI